MIQRGATNRHVLHATGGRVQAGPFTGMRVLDMATWGDGDITSKLLGVYEQELHAAITRLASRRYGAILDIGCAEGYHAIGLARLMPEIPVLGFDTDARALRTLTDAALANGVADRVRPAGICTPARLAELAAEHGPLLIMCDCEGYEAALFADPAAVRAVRHADLIVECHDFSTPGCTPGVIAALWASHRIEIVYPGGRDPSGFAMLSGLSDRDRWDAICENRPALMNWLVCDTKAPMPAA